MVMPPRYAFHDAMMPLPFSPFAADDFLPLFIAHDIADYFAELRLFSFFFSLSFIFLSIAGVTHTIRHC